MTLENGVIVGRVDTDGDHQVSTADPAAFAITIDDDGHIATAEWLSLHHNSADNGDIDETVQLACPERSPLSSPSPMATATRPRRQRIFPAKMQFEDDGPTRIQSPPTKILDDEAQSLFPTNSGGRGDV